VCLWYSRRKAVRYPLTSSWQSIIEAHGVKVDRPICSTLFAFYAAGRFLHGILSGIRTFIKISFISDKECFLGRYIVFFGLKENNLPKDLPQSLGGSTVSSTYDICSWFFARYNDQERFEVIGHDLPTLPYLFKGVSIRRVPDPWLLVTGFGRKLRIFSWFVRSVLVSALDYLRGRWWHAILLGESLRSYCTSQVESHRLAQRYCFHFSGTTFRPLWTYVAESRGSQIVAYFYSTYDQYKLKSGDELQRFEFAGINWPNLYVWTDYQKAKLLAIIGHDSLKVVSTGPIWFSDTASHNPVIARPRSVVVFPIERHRLALYRGVSTSNDLLFSHPRFFSDFLNEIYAVLSSLGIQMVVKLKREIGPRRMKGNALFLEDLAKRPNVTFVDPSMSAFRLMKDVPAAISFPFTSAALCLPSANYPSVYYDSTNEVDKSDPAANGIEIVSGMHELKRWIEKAFCQPSDIVARKLSGADLRSASL